MTSPTRTGLTRTSHSNPVRALFSRGFRPGTVRDSTNPRASPSGHLEEGEPVIDGAVREAGEEVGVTINPDDLAFAHVVHYRAPGCGRAGPNRSSTAGIIPLRHEQGRYPPARIDDHGGRREGPQP